MTTLITFLGTGKYYNVTYVSPYSDNRRVNTCYVARALAEMFDCNEVKILATDKAWETHGEGVQKALSGLNLTPARHFIPEGKREKELRDQFRIIRNVITSNDSDSKVILDITHGFRHQPFFAASVLAVLQASGDLPREIRIVYGAFEAGDEEQNTAPIFDISHFFDLMAVAFGAATFLATGHASALVEALKRERARLAQRKEQGERDNYDETGNLIDSLKDFHDDLSTLRIPFLMSNATRESSSSRFSKAIEEYGKYCDKAHPALSPLIERLYRMVKPLSIPSLHSSERNEAMAHLAELYLQFSRYLEAAAVAREEVVNRFATGDALEAGTTFFDNTSRHFAEKGATDIREVRNKFEIRNDLLHCGMRRQPIPARKLQKNVATLVELMKAVSANSPRTIFVTRHAGARDWAERQGIVVDEMVEHLDPETINPGDLVIGTLPVHLAAEICRRGGRYKHLSMNIPQEHRGRELSADDMEKFCAKLEEFIISNPKDETKEP